MYVTLENVIKVCGLITGLAAVVALGWKLFIWINHQKEQDRAIKALEDKQKKQDADHSAEIAKLKEHFNEELQKLKEHHDSDIQNIKDDHYTTTRNIQEELSLVVFSMRACLKSLNGQGSKDVPEAIDKLDKHLNLRAHGQE